MFSLLVTVSEQVVVTEPEVVLEKETEGLLPCNVIPGIEVGIASWLKGRTFRTAELLVELNLLGEKKEKGGNGYTSGSYDIDDYYSLIIENVTIRDNGHFFCEIVTLDTNENFNNETNVIVFGKYVILSD